MLPQPGEREGSDTPLFYTEEDRVWIRGTNLEGATAAREAKWRAEWEECVGMLEKGIWKEGTWYVAWKQRCEGGR